MDIENIAKELILKNMTPEQQMAVLDSVRSSVAQAKEVQKRKIGENVDLVVQALKKIESDIRDRFDSVGNSIEKRVLSIQDGRDGINGKDGRDGKDGKSGRDGLKGDKGERGQDGRNGVDGANGVSVTNANIDFDGSLIIDLSDGRKLNVGEVVAPDLAEKIRVINTMSTNGAVVVKDEGSSISSGVKSINFVGAAVTATNSGDDVTVNVSAGTGTVTSVAALTLGTSGTDLSSSVATGTTTPVITLNVPTASAANRGALSSTDWSTFNSKGTGTVTSVSGTSPVAVATGTSTPVISMPAATTSVNGYLTSTDWTTFNNKGSGTVTSVTGSSPVTSSGGTTPAISLATAYGDTLNPFASKTANFVLAAPNGSAGVPTFRAVVAADIPTLNQNTTGSAASLSATLALASGGTGATSASAARTSLGLVIGTDVLAPNGSAASLTSFPTLNQNTTGTAASTPKLLTTNFTIEESGGKLVFKYGATTIASMSSTGIITSATNIVSNGTP